MVGRAGLEPATNGLKEEAENIKLIKTNNYSGKILVCKKVCKKHGKFENRGIRT